MKRSAFVIAALAAVLLGGSPAHAGSMLDPSSSLYSAVYGQTDSSGVVYYQAPGVPQTSPTITNSAAGVYPFDGSILLSGATSGTASATPNPANLTAFHFDSTSVNSNSNTGTSGSGSYNYAYTEYVGYLTLGGATNFTLNIGGSQSAVGSLTSGYDYGYTVGYLYSSDFSVFDYYEQYASATDGFGTYGSPNFSGTLAAGSYTIVAYSEAYSQIYAGGGGSVTDAASVTFDLTLTPAVPEPATVTMLGFGVAGLAGYGLRRRKQRVPA